MKCYCTFIAGEHASSACEGMTSRDDFMRKFRNANVARANQWHQNDGGMIGWNHAEWCNALAGEVGELCNVAKKVLRADRGLDQSNPTPRGTLMAQAADEIADVAIYLDLVAARFGFDLRECIARKFNRTSEKMGFGERL